MLNANENEVIQFGIVGLGTAGIAMLPSVTKNEHFRLAGVADLDESVLHKVSQDFPGISVYTDAEALMADTDIQAVFIATPTQHHTRHVLNAIENGKHVVTEKPVATSLKDADHMIEAAESSGVVFMVGHSFGYEAPIKAMREIVISGELGALQMIHNLYYTDWMYRPRNPEELDTSLGGGVTFRQGSHQFDIIRYVGGGLLRSVRASVKRLDPARGAEGAHAVFLEFDSGVVGTAIYNGYDHFRSAELGFNVGENGKPTDISRYGASRKALQSAPIGAEEEMKKGFRYGGSRSRSFTGENFESAPFYGITIISCDRGDIRQSPNGLLIYGEDDIREIIVPKDVSGRDNILTELYESITTRTAPLHSGRWGKANLEVSLAALDSSRLRCEILLEHQVAIAETI